MQPSELDYKKYLQLVVRNKEQFVLIALLLMTLAFVLSVVLPRKYQASSTVFIEKNVISELVRGITVTPSMQDTINVLTYAITSRSLITKVASSLDLDLGKSDMEREALIRNLQRNTVVRLKDNNLFTISFTHANPQVAKEFVNTLVRVYIEENVSSKRGESYDATKFLSEQIETFNTKLEKAENEVNAYKREKGGVISIDEGRLFQEINNAQQRLYDLELRRRQLEGMRQITRTTNDPLQSRLSALNKRLDELRIQFTENYPEVAKVKADISILKEQLASRGGAEPVPIDPQEMARIDSEVAAIKVTEKGLRRYIATNKALLESIPTAKAGLEKLELEKQNQKHIYDQLFARHGQSEVSKQMEVQDKSTTFRVVDPALLPVKPSSPNRLMIMLLGIVGGAAGSFGLLILLDQLNPSVKDVKFVKELGQPVLAIIPRMQDPVQEARRRRRSAGVLAASGLYLMLMLCFPAMELLGLPYIDKLLDKIPGLEVVQSARGLLR